MFCSKCLFFIYLTEYVFSLGNLNQEKKPKTAEQIL